MLLIVKLSTDQNFTKRNIQYDHWYVSKKYFIFGKTTLSKSTLFSGHCLQQIGFRSQGECDAVTAFCSS